MVKIPMMYRHGHKFIVIIDGALFFFRKNAESRGNSFQTLAFRGRGFVCFFRNWNQRNKNLIFEGKLNQKLFNKCKKMLRNVSTFSILVNFYISCETGGLDFFHNLV